MFSVLLFILMPVDMLVLRLCQNPLPEIITNSDQRHGHEFDYNQEASLVRGTKPVTNFNSSSNWRLFRLVVPEFNMERMVHEPEFSSEPCRWIIILVILDKKTRIYPCRVIWNVDTTSTTQRGLIKTKSTSEPSAHKLKITCRLICLVYYSVNINARHYNYSYCLSDSSFSSSTSFFYSYLNILKPKLPSHIVKTFKIEENCQIWQKKVQGKEHSWYLFWNFYSSLYFRSWRFSSLLNSDKKPFKGFYFSDTFPGWRRRMLRWLWH